MELNVIRQADPQVADAIEAELNRQRSHIELIASENFVSPAVMAAMGSCLTNKYAEGYPGHRYYGGCQYVDQVEQIAIDRACKLFGAKYANVQPHSGAQANLAVYFALLNVGDTVMGMDLSQGGHLTHGSPVNMSGKNYNFVSYGVSAEDGRIDYAALAKQVAKVRPKLLVAGASAYPRAIDFEKLAEIAHGYGAMLMESFVAVMALVAASIIEPGLYFAMNTPPAGLGIVMPNLHEMGGENAAMIAAQLKEVTVHAAATVSSWGFVISPEQILQTAKDIGEPSVLNRAGGAPTLAVGIAHVFHKIIPMADMGFWYHFGILFEALFILTALDAGTRAGRFMLQDLLGNFVPFLKKTDSLVAGIIGTAGCVGLWGYLLYQGVVDPLGGVKSLWPLFGISNQMLAAVALVLGTVVLVKMQRTKYIWVTVIPAAWLLLCTTWALGLKLFSSNPQMEGFFFMAQQYKEKIAAGGELTAQQIANMNHIVVNNYTNAGLSILFLVVVYSIIFYGIKTWLNVRNNKVRTDKETPYVPVPEGGVKTSSHH